MLNHEPFPAHMTVESMPAPTDVPADEKLAENPPETEDKKHARSIHKRMMNTVRVAAMTAEMAHVTNEVPRYGSAIAVLHETHSPLLAGATLGATTLAIEGAGALATAGLLANQQSNRALRWVNNKIQKRVPEGTRIPPTAEFGTAMVFGTPALMLLKNAADPNRTLEQNRKHGLFTASWMAALFTAEGAVLGDAVENYSDPKLWAASAIALGGLSWLVRRSKQAIAKPPEKKPKETPETKTVEAKSLTDEQISQSVEAYSNYRSDHDEAVKVGLYGYDPENALKNPRTVMVAEGEEEDARYFPLLVPADELEWYNMEVLRRLYGDQAEIYYYAHPPIPEKPAFLGVLERAIQDKLDSGAVIITDKYESDNPDSVFLQNLNNTLGDGYVLETLGSGELQKKADVFAGPVIFNGVEEIKHSASPYESYKEGITHGEFAEASATGVSLTDTFSDDEAEKIWRIYETPFEKLGADDPMFAGYDKESLLEILKNPDVAKIVKRVEGDVASLCFFVQDFAACPWFNEKYYRDNFREYYETGNVLIFPGIVSDEQRKGSSYSGQLIDLATKVYAKRGSNVLVTFECTEISTRYIPRIVTRAINNSGAGTVSGLEQPISTTTYLALRKASQPG